MRQALASVCLVLLGSGLALADRSARHSTAVQSIGAPWAGVLHDASRLPKDEQHYHLRRPWRSFGTRATVGYVEHAIAEVREAFPKEHVLAIGDLSAEHGGKISGHRSHQSGRDIDIGLYYRTKPSNYPRDFVEATSANLDCPATLALVEKFAAMASKDDGVQMMFLDFDVQGILYRWGKRHGMSDDVLGRLFQYPHGRDSRDGLVRHVANHADHLHVRFKCPAVEGDCW